MGKKRTWQRQFFFLHFACCLVILTGLQGCRSHFRILNGDENISNAKMLMRQGKYVASLKLFEKTLKEYPETHGDQALYNIGIIYIYPENSDKNYDKSLEAFQKLLKGYPISDLRQESVIFVSLLQQIAANEKQIKRLKIKNELERKIERLKIENEFEEKIKLERCKNLDKLQNNAVIVESREAELNKQIEQLKEQIEQYKKQIEEFKKVDMEIEKKKRD